MLLPKCVCLRGSASDPAGGLPAPPAGKSWVSPLQRAPQNCGPHGPETTRSATDCDILTMLVMLVSFRSKLFGRPRIYTIMGGDLVGKLHLNDGNFEASQTRVCEVGPISNVIIKTSTAHQPKYNEPALLVYCTCPHNCSYYACRSYYGTAGVIMYYIDVYVPSISTVLTSVICVEVACITGLYSPDVLHPGCLVISLLSSQHAASHS